MSLRIADIHDDRDDPGTDDRQKACFTDIIHQLLTAADQAKDTLIIIVVGGVQEGSWPDTVAFYCQQAADDANRHYAEDKSRKTIPQRTLIHVAAPDQQRQMPAAPGDAGNK